MLRECRYSTLVWRLSSLPVSPSLCHQLSVLHPGLSKDPFLGRSHEIGSKQQSCQYRKLGSGRSGALAKSAVGCSRQEEESVLKPLKDHRMDPGRLIQKEMACGMWVVASKDVIEDLQVVIMAMWTNGLCRPI